MHQGNKQIKKYLVTLELKRASLNLKMFLK